MHEKTVVVAEFAASEEALVARLRLEAEEITCLLTGETPQPLQASWFGRLHFAPIQIHVAESQAERAAAILASKEPEELDPDWKAQAEAAVEGWICHNCDTPVEETATVCPECATPRRVRKKKRT